MSLAYQYVTEPDSSLVCVICLEVAKDPWQHGKCGKLFCKECIDKYGIYKACPNCRRGPPQYFEDNRSKTEIQALKVKCPNACGNAVERQQLKNHVRNECSHTMTSCKYKGIGCDTELKREDMAAHEQDDKLHLHMALETVATLKEESHTLKGSMTFVLYDYQKKKDANTYYEFSDPTFYTHPKGYHMTLRVYANGSGDSAGTHVSVFAYILKGKYDAELKWPFVGSVTFTLLNQLGDYGHQTGTLYFTTEDNRRVGDCWGFPAFVPHSALAHGLFNNPQYLNDDKLYFRVSAKVADRKPWLE